MRFLFVVLTCFFIQHSIFIYADEKRGERPVHDNNIEDAMAFQPSYNEILPTSVSSSIPTSITGTLFGPINGPIGAPGTGFGGVSCQGGIDSDQSIISHGTVVIDMTAKNELIITVTLKNGDLFANYSIGIFEAADSCGPLADTGIVLTTDEKGNGGAIVRLQLPHTPSGLGDKLGTESIIIVLNVKQISFSTYGGPRFASRPIPISLNTVSPQISISPTDGLQLTTTYLITGAGFTPSTSITPRLESQDMKVVTIPAKILADSVGNIKWEFKPTCDTKIGQSSLWLIDNKTNIISNKVAFTIGPNQQCAEKAFFSADFVANPVVGQAPLKVKFTDTSKGSLKENLNNWKWSFGDGGNSSKQNPEYTFNEPGIYTVGLMAGNSSVSDWEIKANLINVKPNNLPIAGFTASHFIGIAPMKIQFTDMSKNGVDSWLWRFGDGNTSSLQNPLHTYKESGFYTVTLTVSNAIGSDSIEKVHLINVMDEGEPIAEFVGEPAIAFSPSVCNFTNLSSGNIGAWRWDFGDGTRSSEKDPSYIYNKPGIYTVRLTVDGPDGTDQEIETIEIMDGLNSGSGLNAAFVGSPRNGMPGLKVEFNELSTGKISGRLWNFGDTGSSTAQNPEHIYTEKGVYPVSLTVFNNDGNIDTETKLAYIEIKEDTTPTPLTESPTPIPATPTPIQMITPSPTLTTLSTPLPMASATPTENKETSPDESSAQKIGDLLVEPAFAKRTPRYQEAVVTLLDQNGKPIPGITVRAFTNGLSGAMVHPLSAETDNDGKARFKFKFGYFTSDSKIIFNVNDMTAAITQE